MTMPADKAQVEAVAATVESDRVVREEHVEQARVDLAGEVEAERVGLAFAVEADRAHVAFASEAERVDRADAVEVARIAAADTVEAMRVDMAELLEADRKRHNLRLEERLKAETRRTTVRFIVVFLFSALIFGYLAYRSQQAADRIEVNTISISTGQYQSCLLRNTASQKSNEAFAKLLLAAPVDPNQTPEQKQQIQDVFIRPLEDCGSPPPVTG